MDRRPFLRAVGAAAGTAGLGGLAGCVGPAGDPARESDADETSLVWTTGGERLLALSILHGGTPSDQGRYRLRVSVWHRDGTHLDRLRLRLEPAGPPGANAEFYLGRPGGHPWPEVSFAASEDGSATVFEADSLGVQGRGTVTLEFLVAWFGGGTTPRVRVGYGLGLSRGRYVPWESWSLGGTETVRLGRAAGDGGG
jgi:hypothetical protein